MSRAFVFCIAAGILGFASGAAATPVIAEVRLRTHLTSYSPLGTPFECVVIRAVEENGRIRIPQGSLVHGVILRAQRVGLGLRRDRASLQLRFDSYQTPDGETFPLNARLASIDNSRERVLPTGLVRGVVAANDPNRFIFGIWYTLSVEQFSHSLIGLTGASYQICEKFSMGPVGMAALVALRWKMFPLPEPEIHLAPGTDLHLRVVLPPPTGTEEYSPHAPPPASHALSEWLRQEPFRTDRSDGRPAPDIINVAFLGSQQDLLAAFSAAGWSQADPSTVRNYSRMYAAFHGMHKYPSAPVSTLLYRNSDPSFVFEKSFDTVAKRHHVRIWRGGAVDGEEVWLGAATHDTGIGFKFRSVSFTHTIDPNIDLERRKIATDLVYEGCAPPPTRVERQHAASSAGHPIVTDGAISILDLQSCSPNPVADEAAAPPPPGPGRFHRTARRLVLETRNYILRENWYYWGYQVFKYQRASHAPTSSDLDTAAPAGQ